MSCFIGLDQALVDIALVEFRRRPGWPRSGPRGRVQQAWAFNSPASARRRRDRHAQADRAVEKSTSSLSLCATDRTARRERAEIPPAARGSGGPSGTGRVEHRLACGFTATGPRLQRMEIERRQMVSSRRRRPGGRDLQPGGFRAGGCRCDRQVESHRSRSSIRSRISSIGCCRPGAGGARVRLGGACLHARRDSREWRRTSNPLTISDRRAGNLWMRPPPEPHLWSPLFKDSPMPSLSTRSRWRPVAAQPPSSWLPADALALGPRAHAWAAGRAILAQRASPAWSQ